jgi:hypothetical protein
MIKFSKKFVHIHLPKINSVVNIENETFFPFLNDTITRNITNLSNNMKTYAIIYPKDLQSFLDRQKTEKGLENNSEVKIKDK